MKTADVTDYANQTPPKHFWWIKYLSSTDLKNKKIIINCAQNLEVHMFNVRIIIVQILNIKEWKLLELQITQTRHPLSILNTEKNV